MPIVPTNKAAGKLAAPTPQFVINPEPLPSKQAVNKSAMTTTIAVTPKK